MSVFTITLNPAFDAHIDIENFERGKENYAKSKTRYAGGKGVNVSRALCACGVKNTALVLISNESAREFEACLLCDGIEFCPEYSIGTVRENITVHSGVEETRISFEGSGITEDDAERLFACAEKLVKSGDFAVFAGRIPAGLDKGKIAEKLSSLSRGGVKICLDSNSFSCEDIRKIKPYLIKPNEYELAALSGVDISSPHDAAREGTRLCESGAENVLVSLGDKGAVLINSRGCLFARAPKINAVSTVGAGDSAHAGFIAARARGENDADALISAVALGSAKCECGGTLPPTPEAADRLKKLITAEKI